MIKISKSQKEALEVVKKMIVFEGRPKDWADNVFKLIYGILDIEVGTPDIVGDGTIPLVPQGPDKIGRVELTEPSFPVGDFPPEVVITPYIRRVEVVEPSTVPAGNHPFPSITTPYTGDQIPPEQPLNANGHQTAIYDGEVKTGDWVCGTTTAAGEPVSVIGSTTTSADFIPDGGSVHTTIGPCDPISRKNER